jgi:hypothetical protein
LVSESGYVELGSGIWTLTLIWSDLGYLYFYYALLYLILMTNADGTATWTLKISTTTNWCRKNI